MLFKCLLLLEVKKKPHFSETNLECIYRTEGVIPNICNVKCIINIGVIRKQ